MIIHERCARWLADILPRGNLSSVIDNKAYGLE